MLNKSIEYARNSEDFSRWYGAFVLSYATEFLPAVIPDRSRSYTHVLALGCGEGPELLAARQFFGPRTHITGIDSDATLLHPDGADMWRLADEAGADVFVSDMRDIPGVLELLDTPPDVILIRHPTQDVIELGVWPWIRYAGSLGITLLFSTFQFPRERAIRDTLFHKARLEFPDTSIHMLDKNGSASLYVHPKNGVLYYPDYYAFRMLPPKNVPSGNALNDK